MRIWLGTRQTVEAAAGRIDLSGSGRRPACRASLGHGPRTEDGEAPLDLSGSYIITRETLSIIQQPTDKVVRGCLPLAAVAAHPEDI